MTRRLARTPLVVAVVLTLVIGIASPAAAGAWGGAQHAGAPFSWNPGKSLAAGGGVLVSVWASDCPPPSGACATDTTPTMGVFMQRSRADAVPAAWGAPKRLSPTRVQAERPALAADGSTVVVAWVTQRSYLHNRPSAPRVLWVRVSTDRGRTWRTPVRISSARGRVDYPRLAASDGRLYLTWTNADTGTIRLAVSTDRGATWGGRRIGTTTSRSDGFAEGFAGLPDVGASGPNVAVVWFADVAGAQVLATSATGGDDLTSNTTPTTLTTSSPNDSQHYPAAQGATDGLSTRVAVAYSTADGLALRVWDGAGVDPERTITSWPDTVSGRSYAGGYGPSVAPTGTSGLLVAVAGCRNRSFVPDPCDPSDPSVRVDVIAMDSTNDGASWGPPVALTDASGAPYRVNDEPSLAITGPVRRVAFDRYQSTFTDYRVWMRSGS